jgi:hypothetical protein
VGPICCDQLPTLTDARRDVLNLPQQISASQHTAKVVRNALTCALSKEWFRTGGEIKSHMLELLMETVNKREQAKNIVITILDWDCFFAHVQRRRAIKWSLDLRSHSRTDLCKRLRLLANSVFTDRGQCYDQYCPQRFSAFSAKLLACFICKN